VTGQDGTGRLGAADSDTATSALAARSRHYRDLAIARQLRRGRSSLGEVVRSSALPAIPTTGPGGHDELEGGRSAAVTTAPGSAPRGLRWAVPEVKAAAVLLAVLLGGVAATVLPDDVAGTQAQPPGRPASDPGVQAPGATVEHGTATTDPPPDTGPVGGGELPLPPGSTGPFAHEPGGGTPVRSPTTWAPPPSQPGGLPVPPSQPTTSPPTTAPQPTPTTVPTTRPRPTKPNPPPTTKRKPPKKDAPA
jgi:hypothetical protein